MKDVNFTGHSVPLEFAAKIMGKDVTFIREGLKRGILPFGCAFVKKDGGQNYDYYISPKLFYEYTGVNVGFYDTPEAAISHFQKILDNEKMMMIDEQSRFDSYNRKWHIMQEVQDEADFFSDRLRSIFARVVDDENSDS